MMHTRCKSSPPKGRVVKFLKIAKAGMISKSVCLRSARVLIIIDPFAFFPFVVRCLATVVVFACFTASTIITISC